MYRRLVCSLEAYKDPKAAFILVNSSKPGMFPAIEAWRLILVNCSDSPLHALVVAS